MNPVVTGQGVSDPLVLPTTGAALAPRYEATEQIAQGSLKETLMEQLYYLAGLKQGGWLSKTSQYTTDLSQAATFGRTEALARARKHRSASNILLPVEVNMMQVINDQR